jgi:hypothetical protein
MPPSKQLHAKQLHAKQLHAKQLHAKQLHAKQLHGCDQAWNLPHREKNRTMVVASRGTPASHRTYTNRLCGGRAAEEDAEEVHAEGTQVPVCW